VVSSAGFAFDADLPPRMARMEPARKVSAAAAAAGSISGAVVVPPPPGPPVPPWVVGNGLVFGNPVVLVVKPVVPTVVNGVVASVVVVNAVVATVVVNVLVVVNPLVVPAVLPEVVAGGSRASAVTGNSVVVAAAITNERTTGTE